MTARMQRLLEGVAVIVVSACLVVFGFPLLVAASIWLFGWPHVGP